MDAYSKTVLIVEDEEMIRAFIAEALHQEGYRVLQAATPEEASYLWAREEGAIDLVFADHCLPGLTGPELVLEMRLANPDLQVVFMSGFDEQCLRGGPAISGAQFMRKPFSCRAIQQALRKLFGTPVEVELAGASDEN